MVVLICLRTWISLTFAKSWNALWNDDTEAAFSVLLSEVLPAADIGLAGSGGLSGEDNPPVEMLVSSPSGGDSSSNIILGTCSDVRWEESIESRQLMAERLAGVRSATAFLTWERVTIRLQIH